MKLKIIQNQQTPKTEKAGTAQEFIDQNQKLLEKFIIFARKQYNCVGLASNQISVDGVRITEPFFVVKDITKRLPFWELIIHPEILKYTGKKEVKTEACLTWIGKDIVAERYPEIDVRYFDLKGKVVHKRITGFMAQAFQHEYNHLLGIEENVVDRIKK